MPTEAKSQKQAAQTQPQGVKANIATPVAPVQVKLAGSWLQYVKDLPGAEKAGAKPTRGPSVGDDTAARTRGPSVGDDTTLPAQRTDPKSNTVHDGKTHETKYGDFGKEVFKDGAAMEDVQQGYLADCFLVAAMGAVAQQRPDLIEKMIKDNGDGTVTVTLYRDGDGLAAPGHGKPVDVRVSMKLPTANGSSPTYAKASSRELWPSLIEKAYVAEFAGGDYQGVNSGGSPGDVLTRMLGTESTGFTTGSLSAKECVAQLEGLLKQGKPTVAASLDKNDMKSDEALAKLADEKGVYAWHAYVVKKADAKGNTIDLFNPWGSSHPKTLTAEEFQKLYSYVYVGHPKPPAQTPA
jgi:hypothetical protein